MVKLYYLKVGYIDTRAITENIQKYFDDITKKQTVNLK